MILPVCALFLLVPCVFGVEPSIALPQGLVRGQKSENGDYMTYLGIPYAKVNPTNPFGSALPMPLFGEGVFEANNESRQCPQTSRILKLDTVSHSIDTLDCLRLNIYVPTSTDTKSRLPVMVFIHGGGFSGGSGTGLNAQYLVRHGVVLVTINYRLGPYGFMCLDSKIVPGNSGLKDQLIALRWVKENIGAFGGNTDNIIIFGGSAGALSVELHVLSPVSRELFSKAIIQSLSTFSPAELHIQDESPFQIAKKLGNDTKDLHGALEYLAKIEPSRIISTAEELGFRYGPCIETAHKGINGFLTKDPLDIISSETYKSLPLIIGCNSNESNPILFRRQRYNETFSEYYSALDKSFNFKSEKQLKRASQIVSHYYFGFENRQFTFDSDLNFNYPIVRSIDLHLKQSSEHIYYYMFAYVGSLNNDPIDGQTRKGATHGDELFYLFTKSNSVINEDDKKIIDALTTMWTNFAKHGDPTPSTDGLIKVLWKPVSKTSYSALWIDRETRLMERPYHDRMAFWELFYEGFGKSTRYQTIGRELKSQFNSSHVLSYNFVIIILVLSILYFT